MAEGRLASKARCSSDSAALNGLIKSPTTYSGASWMSAASRKSRPSLGSSSAAMRSTRRLCSATEKACAPLVCPFQRATRASPCAMSSISMSSGEGSSRSSRRPLNMRCQARALLLVGAGRTIRVRFILRKRSETASLGIDYFLDSGHEDMDESRRGAISPDDDRRSAGRPDLSLGDAYGKAGQVYTVARRQDQALGADQR